MNKIIEEQRVIPVAVLDRLEHAVPLARALVAGGLKTMELTLRTPVALDCLRAIRTEVPDMRAGAGTVLSLAQVDEVVAAGACFAVAPGLNPRIVRHAQSRGLPFFPGIMTPTDVESALDLGCTLLKLFPASVAGGLDLIKALAGPYGHTGLRLIPLGGITEKNMGDYLAHPLVAAVGGSWLADRARMEAGDWAGIAQLAASARARATPARRD